MRKEIKKTSIKDAFVHFVINRIQNDKRVAACWRRSDNPAMEYQVWDQLALLNIPIDNRSRMLPFVAIGSAIAKAKINKNGSAGIGQAIASCYPDGCDSDQATTKLRRLLSCDSSEEVCRILRPIFSLILSKGTVNLDFIKLLNQLLAFNINNQRIKAVWAQNFYNHKPETRGVE